MSGLHYSFGADRKWVLSCDEIPHEAGAVGSKLKCPVFVASEMSGFKVVPAPIGLG